MRLNILWEFNNGPIVDGIIGLANIARIGRPSHNWGARFLMGQLLRGNLMQPTTIFPSC